MKRVLSRILVLIFIISMPLSVQAATVQEVVNGWKLTPFRETWMMGRSQNAHKASAIYIGQVDAIIKGKTTNYDKLVAIFNSVAGDTALNTTRKQTNNCAAYAKLLYDRLTIAGFKPYTFRGLVTAAVGGWLAHSWNGIDIGGKLFFMDAFMTASGSNGYFLLPQNKGTMYTDIVLNQLDVATGMLTKAVALSKLDTAEKRAQYPPVRDYILDTDWVYNTYQHTLRGHTASDGKNYGNAEFIPVYSKQGIIVTIYADNRPTTYETEEEYYERTIGQPQREMQEEADRINEANRAAAEAERDRILAENEAEREQGRTSKHRHRNPDGTYGPWEDGPMHD